MKFKTTINCQNCVRSVSGFLNVVPHVKSWHVDTESTDKTLTIEGEDVDSEAVIEAVAEAGFDIVPIQ